MRTASFRGPVATWIGAIAVCAAMASPAQAADSGFYVGAEAGMAKYPEFHDATLNSIALTPSNVDDSDKTWAFNVGYRFSRYFAMEAGFLDLGEGSATLVNAAAPANANISFSADGPTLAFIGSAKFELNYYGNIGDEEPTGEANVKCATVGVAYRF